MDLGAWEPGEHLASSPTGSCRLPAAWAPGTPTSGALLSPLPLAEPGAPLRRGRAHAPCLRGVHRGVPGATTGLRSPRELPCALGGRQ